MEAATTLRLIRLSSTLRLVARLFLKLACAASSKLDSVPASVKATLTAGVATVGGGGEGDGGGGDGETGEAGELTSGSGGSGEGGGADGDATTPGGGEGEGGGGEGSGVGTCEE